MDATLVAIVLLLATPFVAHLVGAVVAWKLGPGPNGAADRMPTIPSRDAGTDPPGRRFDRAVADVERKVLRLLRGGNRTLEAGTVAAAIGEPPSLVEAVLAGWRAKVPCRMRVTRRGAILHDFEAKDLSRLRRDRVLAKPARVVLFLLSSFANIGAMWPMIAVAGLSVAGFATMFTSDDETPWWVGGLVAVVAIAGVMLVVWLTSRLVALLVRPWRNDPRPGDAAPAGKPDGPRPGVRKDSGSGGRSGLGKMFGDGAQMIGEGLGPILAILLVVTLLLAFSGAIVGIWLWTRGVWRSVSGRNAPDEDTSPAAWIASGKRPDGIESWFPSTDLVLGLLRTVRTALARPRPTDGSMPARVLALAASQGGWVSRTDLVLAEGLTPDEALSVGARLSGLQEGDIVVRPGGTIDFAFPEGAAATGVPANAPADRLHECLDPERHTQPAVVPVALPGLAWGHITAACRLAAGSLLLAVGSLIAVASVSASSPETLVPVWAGIVLPGLNLGVISIVTAGTYAVSATTRLSVLRDARRRTLAQVRAALRRGDDVLDASAVVEGLRESLRKAWPGAPVSQLRREVQRALLDLDLNLSMPDAAATPGALPFDLRPLRSAFAAVLAARQDQSPARREAGDDEVVFDSGTSIRESLPSTVFPA